MATLPDTELSRDDQREVLRKSAIRHARYWVPCIAFMLCIEAASHAYPFHATRVALSILSAVVTGALGWVIWTRPERLTRFSWWILIAWALPMVNLWSHVHTTPTLAVVFSTMAVLLAGTLLTPALSVMIALPITILLQIYTVANVYAEMPGAVLAPLFSIPLSVLIYIDRRHTILDSERTRRFELALQEQAAQISRLDGLTNMSRYVAHHFNNLLTGIVAGSAAALETIDKDHPSHDWVKISLESAESASDVTRKLIRYSGNQSIEKSPIQPHELFNLDSLGLDIPKYVTVNCQIDENIAPIFGNEDGLREALRAILNNALEAIQASGSIAMTAYRHDVTGGTSLRISDDGHGIPAENVPKVLEPFFTTREPTRMGLGLPLVAGIIRQHSGSVEVASSLETGTAVTLHFPVGS